MAAVDVFALGMLSMFALVIICGGFYLKGYREGHADGYRQGRNVPQCDREVH